MLADVAEELEHGDRLGPVTVVDQFAAAVVEVDDPSQLFLDRCNVVVQRVVVEQVALVGPAARITDHPGCAARESDRSVTSVLEPTQHDQPDQVADVEAVGGGVAAVVDRYGTIANRSAERLTVGGVVDEVARLEFSDQIGPSHTWGKGTVASWTTP